MLYKRNGIFTPRGKWHDSFLAPTLLLLLSVNKSMPLNVLGLRFDVIL